MKYYFFISCFLIWFNLKSQVKIDSLKTEAEEDYSQYENVEASEPDKTSKIYCSQKIIGLSPSKLISLGFDFVGSSPLTVDTLSDFLDYKSEIENCYGIRFSANFPVISTNKLILSLGLNYLDFKYNFSEKTNATHPLINTLYKNGLQSYGVNGTLFKPLNSKHFIIVQSNLDFNSSSKITDAPSSKSIKVAGAAIFGFKPHDRLQYGFGVTRTYRGGGINYIPVILYNYTFKNKKWGVEAVLPARANLRYTINPRNMLFVGYELEGNSYSLNNMQKDYNLANTNLQLYRSELRPRLTYEFSLYNFIWLSVQAGYRIGYNFNVEDGDELKLLSDKPYFMENNLKGSYFFNISINLVSP